MNSEISLLRFCYWLGAILDAIVGLAMVYPPFFALMEGFTSFDPGSDYLFAMGMGAPLMFGWTVLLLWADRKPVERKDVLLITVFPVVVGILLNRVNGLFTGFVNLEGSMISIIMPIFLICVLTTAYLNSYLQGRS